MNRQVVIWSVWEKTSVKILHIFADTKRQSESKEVKGEAAAGCVHDVGEHDVHGVLCANRTRAQHGEAKLERGGGREERKKGGRHSSVSLSSSLPFLLSVLRLRSRALSAFPPRRAAR